MSLQLSHYKLPDLLTPISSHFQHDFFVADSITKTEYTTPVAPFPPLELDEFDAMELQMLSSF
jgi:hypothetical protein